MKPDDDINQYHSRSAAELAEAADGLIHDPSLIHGVYVPMDVRIQLAEAGQIAIQLLAGELTDAIAADVTGRVFNEPEGTSFADRLRRTADEPLTQPDDDDNSPDPDADDDGGKKHKPRMLAEDQRRKARSFVKDLMDKRNEQMKQLASGHIGHLMD